MDGASINKHRHNLLWFKGKQRRHGNQSYYAPHGIKDTQDAQPGPKEDRQGGSASTQKEAAQALTTTAVADEDAAAARYWISCSMAGGAGKRIVRSPDRKPKGPPHSSEPRTLNGAADESGTKQPKAAYQGRYSEDGSNTARPGAEPGHCGAHTGDTVVVPNPEAPAAHGYRPPPTSQVLVLHGVFTTDNKALSAHSACIEETCLDVEEACSKFGLLRQVCVDEHSGSGDVCVLFFKADEAQACQRALNGRWVAGQQITAELTNYAAAMEAQRREHGHKGHERRPSGPETGRQLRDQVQRMQEEMEKLREDVKASGQVKKASDQVAVAVVRGQALISAIASKDVEKVNNILQDPAHDGIKKEIAMHCSYNGMAALHHACRVMAPQWVRTLLEWGPEVANMPTYDGVKPSRWTPLQCLVDNPVTEISTQDDCQAMVSALVDHMHVDAIQNQTAFVERGGGKRSGGLNVLHALASRKSPVFVFTIGKIQAAFGDGVVIAMLNCRTGDGRGVVDMALGSSIAMAMDLKKRFPGAVEQTTSKKLYEEEEKGQGSRRQWQRGDSDYKTHGAAVARSSAKQGERRSRSRDWQEGWRYGWDEGWHQSDWSSHSGWKQRR